MPPTDVKTLRDLLFWQFAKIISDSEGFGKDNYEVVMDRFKKLKSGEIDWSTSITEWVLERENLHQCIYCGVTGDLTVEHMIPLSRGGPDHPDNTVMTCPTCSYSKGDRRLYEFFSLDNRKRIPGIAEGKYLKLLYDELDSRRLLDIDKKRLSELCGICDLGDECPVPEDLTVYCLEGVFIRTS